MQNIEDLHILNTDNPLIQERLDKLKACKEKGFKYPNQISPSHTAKQLQTDYVDHTKEQLAELEIPVSIAYLYGFTI